MKYSFYVLLTIVLFVFGCEKKIPEENIPLIPEENTPLEIKKYDGSIYDFLVHHEGGNYDSLLRVLDRLPLIKTYLKDESKTSTFFAIDNRSFESAIRNMNIARNANGLKSLFIKDIDVSVLEVLLDRYIFEDKYDSKAIGLFVDGVQLFSLVHEYQMRAYPELEAKDDVFVKNPDKLIFSDTNDSFNEIMWDSTNIVDTDWETSKGVVHILESEHEFGFGKLTAYLSGKY